MRIYEIYRSIQGESTYAGLPCTFIRTAGCSLRCTYCDTEYALPRQSGSDRNLDDILAEAERLGLDLVEITGGEPLEQKETPELCARLIEKGAKVLIETGGAYRIDALPAEAVKILDIKTPGSGMAQRNDWENLLRLSPQDEIKFVLTNRDDFAWAAKVCSERGLYGAFTILFSPAFDLLPPDQLAAWILAEKIPVRLHLQQHKYIWGKDARGV
ncbi:MAG: radical SAM protein [Candidatus Omnitrophota bacterium]